MRRMSTFLLGSSAKGLERAAASRTMPSSPVSLLTCHGLSLRSRRTEEWPPVPSTSLLRQPLVSCPQYMSNFSQCILNHKSKTTTNIVQENHWSLRLRPDSSFLEVNQQAGNSPPLRLLGLKTAQFLRFLRLVMVLDPSSYPPFHHSWLFVGGGGWENQPPQIA